MSSLLLPVLRFQIQLFFRSSVSSLVFLVVIGVSLFVWFLSLSSTGSRWLYCLSVSVLFASRRLACCSLPTLFPSSSSSAIPTRSRCRRRRRSCRVSKCSIRLPLASSLLAALVARRRRRFLFDKPAPFETSSPTFKLVSERKRSRSKVRRSHRKGRLCRHVERPAAGVRLPFSRFSFVARTHKTSLKGLRLNESGSSENNESGSSKYTMGAEERRMKGRARKLRQQVLAATVPSPVRGVRRRLRVRVPAVVPDSRLLPPPRAP